MQLDDPDIQRVQKVLNERGYSIITYHSRQLSPGEILTDTSVGGMTIDHPFYVLGETDYSDYVEHCRVGWPDEDIPPHNPYIRYYRVTTD